MDEAKFFVIASLLGFMATEGVVEFVAGNVFDFLGDLKGAEWVAKWKPPFGKILKLASAGVGIAFAFYYCLDGVAVLTGLAVTTVGKILTGVIIGRGANGVRWLFSQVRDWREQK